MKIFTIGGWSGGGKTTLMVRLIKHWRARGKGVVAAKGAPHKFYLEPETVDTFQFFNAGAGAVYLASRRQLLRTTPVTEEADVIEGIIEGVINDAAPCDFLLLEGLRRPDIPMIEVYDPDKHPTRKFPDERLCALVTDSPTDEPGTVEIPCFRRDAVGEIADFMENYDGK